MASACSKVATVPPELARGCYAIDLPGGSLVKSDIYASVGDILEPLANPDGSTLEIEEAGNGYIARSTFKDQLSGSEKRVALQFDRSSQRADNSDSPIGDHCGPEVYKVSRSMLGDEEQSVIATAQMVGELVSKSAWRSEAIKRLTKAERVRQVPAESETNAPYDGSSPSIVEAQSRATPAQSNASEPYTGTFKAPNGLGDLTVTENEGRWIAKFSVGAEGGLAADCNVTAKSVSVRTTLFH